MVKKKKCAGVWGMDRCGEEMEVIYRSGPKINQFLDNNILLFASLILFTLR